MQDLRTLAIFVKVAERLSFVGAATDLGIAQSGVSNAISRLEEQIARGSSPEQRAGSA
jgi:DNA-binding transcriptional LysR family regulator